MAYIPRPPHTGDVQLDSVLTRVVDALNRGIAQPSVAVGGSSGGGGGSDTQVGNSIVYIYSRTTTATPPDRGTLPDELEYDFNNENNPVTIRQQTGWSPTLPREDAGEYLWISYRYVVGRSSATPLTGIRSSWDNPSLIGRPGENGSDAVSVALTTNRGTVFKNTGGSPITVTATVFIAGIEQDAAAHRTYEYTWRSGGDIINISTDGSVDGPGAFPAEDITGQRTIIVGPEDIMNTRGFTVEVRNIPE